MKTIAAALLVGAHILAAQTASLIVLNKEDKTLAIVEPSSNVFFAKIPTGEGPHEVAVSTDGRFAFVGNYGSGQTPGSTISVIDLVARKEVRRVDVSPLRRPHGIAFNNGKVYFTAEVNKIVARYDPATNQIDWMIGTGQNSTHMVMLNKDGSKIFTANIGSDSISIFERGTNPMNWNQTVIPVGKGPEGMDISPDGTELWTAHSRDGGVSIIDIEAKKVTETLSLGTKRSNRLKFTPDGKMVLITDLDAGHLIVLDRASRKEVKRFAMGKTPEGILITPDGSRAYVGVAGDNQVAIVDLNTLEVIERIATGAGPDGMAWAVRK
jgi:YVTN family beta-propeller protein